MLNNFKLPEGLTLEEVSELGWIKDYVKVFIIADDKFNTTDYIDFIFEECKEIAPEEIWDRLESEEHFSILFSTRIKTMDSLLLTLMVEIIQTKLIKILYKHLKKE